jgi:DMSO/TMAO reductase YedYZ molybdopterin-dependent catalytic subunit
VARASFVVFHSYDDGADSIDLLDALHPQRVLAHGMNGRDLRPGTARPSGCGWSGRS